MMLRRLELKRLRDLRARMGGQNRFQSGGGDTTATDAEQVAERAARHELSLCAMKTSRYPTIQVQGDGVADLAPDFRRMPASIKIALRPLTTAQGETPFAKTGFVASSQTEIMQDRRGEEQRTIMSDPLMLREQDAEQIRPPTMMQQGGLMRLLGQGQGVLHQGALRRRKRLNGRFTRSQQTKGASRRIDRLSCLSLHEVADQTHGLNPRHAARCARAPRQRSHGGASFKGIGRCHRRAPCFLYWSEQKYGTPIFLQDGTK